MLFPAAVSSACTCMALAKVMNRAGRSLFRSSGQVASASVQMSTYSQLNAEKPRMRASGYRNEDGWKAFRLCILAIAVSCGALQTSLSAQQTAGNVASDRGLPDAPGRGDVAPSVGRKSVSSPASAGISGTVLDTNGDVISGARVTLTATGGAEEYVLLSGGNGEFAFSKLPPGTFKLTVTAPGMGNYVAPEVPLLPGDMRLLPGVVLPIVASTTSVRVYADRNEIAEEQVHLALDQRVLGVLPNFYSTYDWNAPPLGPRQKFELAFRSVTDPVAFLGAGILAGVQQGNNSYPAFGQGVPGYAKRYAAAYANDISGRMLASAVLPSLFHQDPRYFYKGSGSIGSRALYAVSASVIARSDTGHWQPSYAHLLGTFAAGGLSNLYYPSASRGVSLTIMNGLLATADNAANNLLREFVLRRLTPRASTDVNGKP